MQKNQKLSSRGVFVLAVAVAVSSCSGDVVSPVIETPGEPLFSPAFFETGQVRLCKYAPGQTVATWADFALSTNPTVGTFPRGTEFRLDAGTVNWDEKCEIVWTPPAGLDDDVVVTITEVDMTPGLNVAAIVVYQQGVPMNALTGSRTINVTVGPGYGAIVYFKNEGEPQVQAEGETATGAGFPWSATQRAPNNWFMYTPWSTTNGHLGISGGTTLIAGRHHEAGTITGTRTNGGNGRTTITITLNSSFTFDGASGNVKIHPMSCTTSQPYVSPGQFAVHRTAAVTANSITVPDLPNTACYGIHVDVLHAQ
jgi:hypothetical protein